MFTGIIEEVGRITGVSNNGSRQIGVLAPRLASKLKRGDSISVSGVCLTVTDATAKSFSADLADETWLRTSFRRLRKNASVNLELPLRASGRFDGHIVQGHVDGTGTFQALERLPDAEDYRLRLEIPSELTRYVVYKGSLAIEGISLTVAEIEGRHVSVAVIPHTAKVTNLKFLKSGDAVNLEVDVIAKYVERMMRGTEARSAISLERLVREGF
ncbi:MAG: riboflavin synthase [Acidobacteriales bacterium]|nr:riboflavin synthase [Terriglobales bacterium]